MSSVGDMLPWKLFHKPLIERKQIKSTTSKAAHTFPVPPVLTENPAECQQLITVSQNLLLQYLEVRWRDETESPLTTEHLWSDHVYYLYPLHVVFLKLCPFHFVQL